MTSALPNVTNAYPGMSLPMKTIEVANQGSQAIVVHFTVNGEQFPEYLQGTITVSHQNKTTTHTLAAVSKGISLQMGSKETLRVQSHFTLSGELMGNGTQDTSFDIHYHFTANEDVILPSNNRDTPKVETKEQTKLPKANETSSMLISLGCFLVGLSLLVLLQKLKYRISFLNYDRN